MFMRRALTGQTDDSASSRPTSSLGFVHNNTWHTASDVVKAVTCLCVSTAVLNTAEGESTDVHRLWVSVWRELPVACCPRLAGHDATSTDGPKCMMAPQNGFACGAWGWGRRLWVPRSRVRSC